MIKHKNGGYPAGRKEVGTMQYFGVPTCPYCKKRVNLIRTWSLKKQGEYQCPRCGGISNIYLSPLIYVLALLALFAGGAVYFFHKFVLDDIGLETAVQVFLPFAGFFLFSLFFVYLAKPVIKKVSKEDMGKKRFGRKAGPSAAGPAGQTGRVYYDREDYPPQRESFTTPLPPQPAPPEPPVLKPIRPTAPSARPASQAVPAAPQAPPARAAAPAPVVQPPRRLDMAPPPARTAPARQQNTTVIRPPVPVNHQPARPARAAAQTEPPKAADDFFAKYDDPAYVQRRLREMNGKDR